MTPLTLAWSDTRESETAVHHGEMRLENRLLISATHRQALRGTHSDRKQESAVEHNEAVVKSKEGGLKSSCDLPTDFAFAESFGGSSECLPFWHPSVWPFRSIRLFEEEDE
jgi:hypothetical protein